MSAAVDRILAKLPDAKPNGKGWIARCPAHDDHDPSLCIDEGTAGKCLLTCQAGCPVQAIVAAMGLDIQDLFADGHNGGQPSGFVAIYDYTDAAGVLLFQVCRTADKQFPQRRPMPDGSWAWGLSAGLYVKGANGDWRKAKRGQSPDGAIELPACPKILYRLPELLAADPDEVVFACEGEKDADNLAALGLVATCNPGGSGKWKHVDDAPLRDRHVVVVPDIDDAGRKHAPDVAHRLRNKATVRVLWLPIPEGHDATDFILDRRNDAKDDEQIAAEFRALAEAAPEDGTEPVDTASHQGDEPSETCRAVRHRMSSVEVREVEWLWFARIPLSTLTLIAGLPGEAKSFLTADLAAHVTTGQPWPDTDDPVPVGNVVMMNSEDDLSTVIKPRLIQAGADCNRVEAFTTVIEGDTERPVNVTHDAHLLEQIIEEWGNVKLVTVDPVLTFLGGRMDMNRENEVREALGPLVRIAQRHRLAVVAVAHLNKSSQMRAIHRITGAGGFSGLPRALHGVEADREDRDLRKFAAIKVTSVKNPPTLSFRLEGFPVARVIWQAGSTDETADEIMGNGVASEPETAMQEAKAFLRSLLERGPVPTKDVYAEAKAAEISKRTLERAKSALKVMSDRFKYDIGASWYMMLPKDYPLVPEKNDDDAPC